MDEAFHDLIREKFAAEDTVLQSIQDAIAERGLPAITIRPEEGRLLQFFLRSIGAQTVVEIGTLAGYSGIWLARALPPGGTLITVERDPERAELAERFFAQAELTDRARVHIGEAPVVLDEVAAAGPFDAVFIDANKREYPAYLDWAVDNVRVGGLILAHNAFFGGRVTDPDMQDDPNVQGLHAAIDRVATDPRLDGMIFPIGDGILAALKIA